MSKVRIYIHIYIYMYIYKDISERPTNGLSPFADLGQNGQENLCYKPLGSPEAFGFGYGFCP